MTDSYSDQHLASAVRTIPPKTKGNRGYFPSSKIENGVVEYESQIERDFYLLLNHADDVVKFQHQPVKINFISSEGKKKKYVPDVYVRFKNNIEIIVEIKDENSFVNNKSKYLERWTACSKWCDDNGYSFIVLTENDIRSARFYNIWFTIGSSKVVSNDMYITKVAPIILDEGVEYNILCHAVSVELSTTLNKASQIISYGIYHGLFFVDTISDKILSGSTIIRSWNYSEKSPFKPLWVELDEALQRRDDIELFRIRPKSIKKLSNEKIPFLNNTISHREIIIKEFLQTPSNKRGKQWRTDFENKYNTPISTVYVWVKRFQTEGKIGLQTKYEKSGRKSTNDDYTKRLLETAKKTYLKTSYTLKRTYEDVILKNWNKKNSPPSYPTFCRYINNATSYYDRELLSRGSRRKKDLQPSLLSFQGAIMPMQVLQFDNTPFDLFLRDEAYFQSIGTPNLCAAIDVFTRQITGFELTLNSINRQSILETLVQTIDQKDRYLKSLFFMEEYIPKWDVEGFPVMILVDNGMDYRSNDVKRFCLEFDIILEFVPLATPRYKAYIENWFNVLKEGLRHELSEEGFRPNLKERLLNPDLNPEANVIFTSQQCEKWLISWILDEYHYTNPYNDGLPAPSIRYNNYEKGRGEIILPQPRDTPKTKGELNNLLINGLVTSERVLGNNIEFMNLKYSSPVLITLYHKLGKRTVTILYDMRDIRVIWIKHPVTNIPIELELTNGWANAFIDVYKNMPVSLSFWKKEVALIKKQNRKKIDLTIFRKERGRNYRKSLRSQTRPPSKRELKKKAALMESERKLARKLLSDKDKYSKQKHVIQIRENGEFVRNYVPISQPLKKKLEPNKKSK